MPWLKIPRFYSIYWSMRMRCENPKRNNYYLYGAKGIKCTWKTYSDFKKDMLESYQEHVEEHGERNTTIERIDNTKNYGLSNCRWATTAEQSRNTSQNVWLTFNGKTQVATDWAKELGIKRSTIYMRLNSYGWSVEKTLSTPVRIRT